MRKNRWKHIKNGIKMVRRNLRAYAFLSVTIIISFSTLLIFLVYSDSMMFHKYKDIQKSSPYISIVSGDTENEAVLKRFDVLSQKLDELEDTHYYFYSEQQISLQQFSGSDSLYCKMEIVPPHCWGFYYSSTHRMTLLDGAKEIALAKNQIIINHSLFRLLNLSPAEDGKLYLSLPVKLKNNRKSVYTFEVVGICDDENEAGIYEDAGGRLCGQVNVLVSAENFLDVPIETMNHKILIYSKDTNKVGGWLEELDLSNDTSYFVKKEANEEMRYTIFLKACIAIALLFLLGVNLYSSFSNALSERKFEIGVRRAIGASRTTLLGQFFIEGLSVMVANMLLSVMTAISVLSIYRIIRFFAWKEKWIVVINGYSIGIFLCCCVFLSLIYSIIFAALSLRVEIVHYLKNE